jgi:hypothetical protein
MKDKYLTEEMLKARAKKRGLISRTLRGVKRAIGNPFEDNRKNRRTLSTLEVDFERIFSANKISAVADASEE